MPPVPERDGPTDPSRLVLLVARSGIVTDFSSGIKTHRGSDTTPRAGGPGPDAPGRVNSGEYQQAHDPGQMAVGELVAPRIRRGWPGWAM